MSIEFSEEDRIFLGEGLFETIKFEAKQMLYSELHWQRMHDSAKALHIPFNISFATWQETLQKAIQENILEEGGIKVTLGNGPALRGLEAKSEHSQLFFHVFPTPDAHKPLKLVEAPWVRDSNNPIYQYKTINYLESIMARRFAHAQDADDALFFSSQGAILETTVANIFVIKNNTVYTPSLCCGVLNGVMRQQILRLCQKQEIPWKQDRLSKSFFLQAEAAFTTNALQGIRPVRFFEEKVFHTEHYLIQDLSAHIIRNN